MAVHTYLFSVRSIPTRKISSMKKRAVHNWMWSLFTSFLRCFLNPQRVKMVSTRPIMERTTPIEDNFVVNLLEHVWNIRALISINTAKVVRWVQLQLITPLPSSTVVQPLDDQLPLPPFCEKSQKTHVALKQRQLGTLHADALLQVWAPQWPVVDRF